MYFDFTEDQREFANAINGFFMNEVTPELLRELWRTETGRSKNMWAGIASLGVMGVSVPEEFGGLGLGDDDWTLIAQTIGYYAAPDGLIETAWLSAGMLKDLPQYSELRGKWLERIAKGEARVAIGHPVNPYVADAHVADILLLAHGDEVHAVEPENVRLTPYRSVDPSRRLFHVEWEHSDTTRLTTAESGKRLWANVLNRGALAAASQMNGLAQRIIDLSVDYTAQRKQFGKPIGSFQAVKHHIANIAVNLEFSKPVAYRAGYTQARQSQSCDVHVSHAKLAATETARLACRNGVQAHGAIGYTWEMDLQIFMKRAWALDGAWGDETFHKLRIGEYAFAPDAALGPGCAF